MTAASNMSDLLELVARFFSPVISNPDDEYLDDEQAEVPANRSKVYWIAQAVVVVILAPLKLLWWTLASPVLILRGTDDERIGDLMAGLPAVAVFATVVFFLVRSYAMSDTNGEAYRVRAVECLRRQDFSKAKTYYSRLVLGNNLAATEMDKLNWVQTLYRTGDHHRASAILDELAPDDRQGLESAHLFKALKNG